MDHTTLDGRSMLEQLQVAGSGADVVRIVDDVSAAKQLGPYAKEPGVRKAIMLLANPDPALDVQARLRCLAFLASLATVKPVRHIVDEFAPRALSEPLSDAPSSLSQQEKALLAAWLSGRKIVWIADFAARTAVAESNDERLCQTYMALFFSKALNLSRVIQQLTDEFVSSRTPPESAGPLAKFNLCRGLARSAATRAKS